MDWFSLIASPAGLAVILAHTAWLFEARTGHVPNLLTLPMLLLGVVLRVAAGETLWCVGGIAAAALGLRLWQQGLLGGGAAKLLLAVGALAGPVAPGLAMITIHLLLLRWRGTQREVLGSPAIALSTGAAVMGQFALTR